MASEGSGYFSVPFIQRPGDLLAARQHQSQETQGLLTSLALGSNTLTVTAMDNEGKVCSRDTVTALQTERPTSMARRCLSSGQSGPRSVSDNSGLVVFSFVTAGRCTVEEPEDPESLRITHLEEGCCWLPTTTSLEQ